MVAPWQFDRYSPPDDPHVVGIFPDDASVERLIGNVLLEIDDDWHDGRRYFSHESMAMLSDPEPQLVGVPAHFTLTLIK